jgi:hypothetical protein
VGTVRSCAALDEIAASIGCAELELHDGKDFPGMLALYERMGLIQPYMLSGLRPPPQMMTGNWRKLHQDDTSVAFTLIWRGRDGDAQGAVSGVRAWDRTWLAQHFGVLPHAEPGTAAALQLAFLGFVGERADTHHLCFFVTVDNAQMNAWFERFFRLGDAFELGSRIDLARWAFLPSVHRPAGSAPAGLDVTSTGLDLHGSAFAHSLGSVAAEALTLRPQTTSSAFARLGLERHQRTLVLSHRGREAGLVIEERASPGLSLSWMLDSWWFLGLGDANSLDGPTVERLMSAISNGPVPEQGRILLIPRHVSGAPLQTAGFTRVADARLYTLNRAGIRRYRDELALRYTEVRSAMKERRARAARKPA